MGLLDDITRAVREANEGAHGARLKRDVFLTLELIGKSPQEIKAGSLQRFLSLREKILTNCQSWSREGKLKVAAQLQKRAREHKDLNVAEAYGY